MKRNRLKRNRPARATSHHARGLEPLESRQHMSVTTVNLSLSAITPNVVIERGTIQPTRVIDGTASNDHIVVSYSSSPLTGRRLAVQRNAEPEFYLFLAADENVRIHGLAGNDYIRFDGSIGVGIRGGDGDDILIGGTGSDVIYGENGNDTLDGRLGADMLGGGTGVDTADYAARTAPLTVNIDQIYNDGQAGENDNVSADTEGVRGGSAADVLTGNAADNVLHGNAGDDVIRGGGGLDMIRGGAGNDQLHANAGFYDHLYGDAGQDKLYGGSGPDYLRGGADDDTIISVGGGQTDYVWGEHGFDSFWVDAEATERLWDAGAAETARNVHRVAGFESLKVGNTHHAPPSRELLGQDLADPTPHNPAYAYKRFSDVPLFVDGVGGPSPDDVNQGDIGDCYFLAPLSAIAKASPNVIRQAVVELGDGTFAVEMRRDGQRRYIRVDADMPASAAGNMVYAKWANTGPQMWVPVMEKAWALFRNSTGTYQGIAFGYAKEPYNALGVSNDDYDPYSGFNDSPQEFGNNLANMLAQGRSVTLCTGSGAGVLAGSHCYTIDRVNKVGSTVVSIVLRNPWGTDGPSAEGANDGYVTLTAAQCLNACELIVYGAA